MPASPEAATPARIRSRATYRMFRDLLTTVQTGDERLILTAVHRIIDGRRGFRSQRNSDCALQSMEMVLLDGEATNRLVARSIAHATAYDGTVVTIPEPNYPTYFFTDVVEETPPPADTSFASENTLGNFPRR